MHSTTLFATLALGASLATASETVVLTAKMTQVKTITRCADSYSDCPLSKTSALATSASSSSSSFAAATTTTATVPSSSAAQTPVVETTPVAHETSTTSLLPASHTTIEVAPTGMLPGFVATTGPVLVPTGAAGGLRVQNAAAVVAVAAVIAMVY
ncbi:hypothetical protein E4U38_008435 [Claviceps purpurea]|nr:hypothetical protein E4U38_008435 [Claviceps purpurea]KAG6164663.1 hypothetical protein E4U11_001015 [Claviceps purpurea]